MPNNRAEQKLKELGLLTFTPKTISGPASPRGTKRYTFKLYFPRPPYNGALYHAAYSNGLFNFVGLVLGHHGTTIQRIQKDSSSRVEIHDKDGNLNGDHPSADDPSLHAFVTAETKENLEKAVNLLLDVLAPINTDYEPVKFVPGGSAILQASLYSKPAPSPPPAALTRAPSAPVAAAPTVSPAPARAPLNAWVNKDSNPALTIPKSSATVTGKEDVVGGVVEDKPLSASALIQSKSAAIGSKRNSYEVESQSVSYGLDSLHSFASGAGSDEVNTPTSVAPHPLSSGSSSQQLGYGLFGNTNSSALSAGGHQVPEEFSLWHPFAAGGLFDELQQTLTPRPEATPPAVSVRNSMDHNGHHPSPVLFSAPFPGVGSFGMTTTQQSPASHVQW